MFDWLHTLFIGKEKRTQLYFREDGKFVFVKREVEDTFLVEKKAGSYLRAWKMFYKLQLFFDGYQGIPRDMVTLSYARDIIFDPFNKLDDSEKPKSGKDITKPWVTTIFEAQRYKRLKESSKVLVANRQIMIMGGVLGVMVLGLAIKFAF